MTGSTPRLTARERMTLRELAEARSLFHWAPKTCVALAEKGLAVLTHDALDRPGYRITEAGRAALSRATGDA